MAYYDALIAKWPSLAAGTTAQKVAQINTITQVVPKPAVLSVNAIINAILPADFEALTATQVAQMQLLLGGGATVDASVGTTIRAVFQFIFTGKATTLANLSALVAPFDNAVQPWWQANGYLKPVELGDATAAGLV